MNRITDQERRRLERLTADERVQLQLTRLNQLLKRVLPDNPFYRAKLAGLPLPVNSLEQLAAWPTTTKEELVGTATPPNYASNRTYDLHRYVRFHQTSGTRGHPLVVLDTEEDWRWWVDTWQFVLDAANVTELDRVLLAFSFGPFIGFWSAFDAVIARNALTIPAGGLSTLARLEIIFQYGVTVLCCTPSYALHLGDVARQRQLPIADSAVNRIIVAGEPGGSVPATRDRIEQAWRAKVVDHAGATEVGPWGYADRDGQGLFIIESEFLPEFQSLEHDGPAKEGELAELILTCLGRAGSPLIRYRTGDLVRPTRAAGDNQFVFLPGGVLGRVDDMMIIRGVNIYPSAVEGILREFPEIAEYRLTAYKAGRMDALRIEIEDPLNQPARVAEALRARLSLHVEVQAVAAGSLPRFELKGKRFIDQR